MIVQCTKLCKDEGMQITDLSSAGNLYKATLIRDDSGEPFTVDLYNTWDHDGGNFPAGDLDTMIQILTDLRAAMTR